MVHNFNFVTPNLPTPTPIRKRLSMKEFEELLDRVDTNGDGLISQKELEEALRELGLHFTSWKAWRARRHADINKNRYIDGESERRALIDVLRERWGIVVYV